MLVHVVDCATLEPGRDPISDIEALEAELAAYTPGARRGRPGRAAAAGRAQQDRRAGGPGAGRLRPRRARPSGSAGRCSRSPPSPAKGLRPVDLRAVATWCRAYRAAQPVDRAAPPGDPADRRSTTSGFTVDRTRAARAASSCAARGPNAGSGRPTSTTTRPSATSATGWPGSASRTSWLRLGAKPGCAVTIGDVTFDWEPPTPAGVDVMLSGRGTDRRLEQTDRGRRRTGWPPGSSGAGTAPTTSSSGTPRRTTRECPGAARGGAPASSSRSASSSLTSLAGGLDPERLDALVDALAARRDGGLPGRAGVVRARSRRASPRSGCPPPARPGHPAGRRQRRPAALAQTVRARRSPATAAPVGQVLLTADDIDPPCALPQRPAHPGAPARAGRGRRS